MLCIIVAEDDVEGIRKDEEEFESGSHHVLYKKVLEGEDACMSANEGATEFRLTNAGPLWSGQSPLHFATLKYSTWRSNSTACYEDPAELIGLWYDYSMQIAPAY